MPGKLLAVEMGKRESTSSAPRAGFTRVDWACLVLDGLEDAGSASGAGLTAVDGSVLVLDSLSNEERHF